MIFMVFEGLELDRGPGLEQAASAEPAVAAVAMPTANLSACRREMSVLA